MDIKLKNSRKDRIIGVVVVVIATILFHALCPQFEKKVEDYYTNNNTNAFENSDFINILLESNYVLYKDVKDQGGVVYTQGSLYVDIEEEITEQVYTDAYEGDGELLQASVENVKELYIDQLEQQVEENRELYVNGIAKRMDYCVLDHTTGTVLKNTSQSIEKLARGEKEWENPYAYYVILKYDERGRVVNVTVKGQNAEKFLKEVQIVANNSEAVFLKCREQSEKYAVVDVETDTVEKELIFTQKKPESVTFVYAMTAEQKEQFFDTSVYESDYLTENFGDISREDAFYMAGVGRVFMLFCIGIAIFVLIYAKYRRNAVEETIQKKVPLEVLIVAAIFAFGWGSEMAIRAVSNSSQDYYVNWLNDFLPVSFRAGSLSYMIVEYMIHFCIIAVFFGIWYWCIYQVKDIINGVGTFIKERSFICRKWKEIWAFVKRSYYSFKEEVIHADLGEDNKKLLGKIVILNFVILAIICCFWGMGIFILIVYSIILYVVLKKYLCKMQEQYANLLEATNSIAEGNLNHTFEEDFGVFESYKEELYKVQGGFRKAVDEEVKSQKMRTELITNVSHDLKTPLTAIITYIELLKEENVTEEQRKEYLATLERKSLRLKVLIEDLFEVSKANSGDVQLNLVPVDICNLLRQVYLEHEEQMKQKDFDVRFSMPEEKVILQLDSQKTYRIFENLYINVMKYAMTGTRVYVNAEKRGKNGIHIEIKNMSAQEITINPQDLTERFVRGDASRNTEGSGLGLAIAKSFTELQGGTFRVDTDGDLFKVIVEW